MAAVVVCLSIARGTALVAADCNGNGVDDADDIASGTSADCNGNEAPDECEPATRTFADAMTRDLRPAGTATLIWNTTLTPADLDSDGDLDLVTSSEGTASGRDNLLVLLNQGDGTFAAPVHYTVGTFLAGLSSAPLAHAAAELDLDGDLDIVTANPSSDSITLLFNDGTGSFSSAVEIAVGDNPRNVVAGDLEGDGDQDLIVADHDPALDTSRSSRISVLWNHGNGDFDAPVHYPLGGGNSTCCRTELIRVDLDRDGDLDLVAEYGTLAVFLANADGTLGSARLLRHDGGVGNLTVADIDADGSPDLIAAGFRCFIGRGDGTFEAPFSPPLPFRGGPVLAGDLDGDGNDDLAAANWVYFGNGAGGFVAYQAASCDSTVVRALRDMDGDGDLDLVLLGSETDWGSWCASVPPVRDQVVVRWNHGDRRFSRPTFFPAPGELDLVSPLDLDGDGSLDLAALNVTQAGEPRTLSVLLNRPAPLHGGDCDTNGILDDCESGDCNGNGLPDSCDIASGTSLDCNSNGTPDECDIRSGSIPDVNQNQIPDDCETLGVPFRRGDVNQDGQIDLSDAIWLLGHLFLGSNPVLPCEGGPASNPGQGDLALVDVNGDREIDLSDGVSLLGYLFLGSTPPSLGTACVPIVGCPDNSGRCAP